MTISVEQLKILLVEDNEIALKVHKLMITHAGCVPDVAETGEEALSKARDGNYDLIFMDIGLPDIDGITVTARIRESETEKKAMIVGLTAHDLRDVEAKCLAAGMNTVISKPTTLEALKHIINGLC